MLSGKPTIEGFYGFEFRGVACRKKGLVCRIVYRMQANRGFNVEGAPCRIRWEFWLESWSGKGCLVAVE